MSDSKIKPVIILPNGEMSREDIAQLREIGFCAVEAEHPDSVRFLAPPPESYGPQERAAIKLARYIMSQSRGTQFERSSLVEKLAQCLIEGTPLQPVDAAKTIRTK